MRTQLSNDILTMDILILEDNPFDRVRLRRAVGATRIPYTMREVENLQECQEALRQSSFEIFFLDFNLPDGNGHDALLMLKQSAGNSHIPAMMITDNECPLVKDRALELGCAACVYKSRLTAEAFKQVILEAVEFARKPTKPYSHANSTNCALNLVSKD